MLKKDRYSHAIIMAIVLVTIALFLFSKGKEKTAGLVLLLSPVYFSLIVRKPGRLNGSIPEGTTLKDENSCGFTGSNPTKIDGLKLNNLRYKVVNGADVYINDQGEIKPCGFGSAVMLKIGKGGYLPEAPDECWE